MFRTAPEDAPIPPRAPGEPDSLPDAVSLDRLLVDADPVQIIRVAREVIGRERLAVVSSFGTESAVLLKLVSDVDPAIPVLLLDTGWLFPETIAHRDALVTKLGLTDVRSIAPDPNQLKQRDPYADLWSTNPDACCAVRKVEPLADALTSFAAWMNGRKRYQGGQRTHIPVVEQDGVRLKFNPLARVAPADVLAIARSAGLPPHPLAKFGFTSVGCMPCTRRTLAGEDQRAGRWSGTNKTECGIHTTL
ncbi:MAG: phosphoadenylyl-sulfate reductase [Xanthobacteraceae bacterium]|nr:phosphoadenylyl-sulfate reductase [Xanthobacteraceae bacterium]MBV9236676.1 phosphoadenylyl-sulfate reductase [Xanthobacteraceae bacterium]MBV9630895.1 phosphoadenylyl-sulfate reductase [Xanthobacteraceae bacterium]